MEWNIGKLLITAFVAILIGVILIQSISTDVELTKVSSYRINNESIALTTTAGTIANETMVLVNGTLAANVTGTLVNNFVISLTGLRNETSQNLLGYCNITVNTGVLSCNRTDSPTAYADYTYSAFRTGATANDEVLTLDNCYNVTMNQILVDTHCNITLATGAVTIEYDNVTTGNARLNYTYEPDTYVHSGAARVLLTNTVLFFVIGILAVGIGLAIKSFREGGIM